MTERNEISAQEVRFYIAAQDGQWHTATELAGLSKVATRTARAISLKFVRLGLFDLAEVWPAHKYRWSKMAGKRNRSYLQRLEQSCEVFGIPIR